MSIICRVRAAVHSGRLDAKDGEKIIDALEKQKPKKFICVYGANIYGGIVRTCPTCADKLVLSESAMEYELYCRHCGQKIERSVNNE